MVRHIVLFKFRDEVTWADPRAQRAEQASQQHPHNIPDILSWECGRNITERLIAYDFGIVGKFVDYSAVLRYLVHPDHVEGAELWRQIATWIVVDFTD